MKTLTISAHFECDACEVDTADTDGSIPEGWKEGSRVDSADEVRIHICPSCSASEDPAVIQGISRALLGT